jgi:phage terminase small subunit
VDEHTDEKKHVKKRFDIPKRTEFVKKKTNRNNLIKKSAYLGDLLDKDAIKKFREEDKLLEELKLQEKIREQNIEKNLNQFMEKINNLKNTWDKDKMDILINQRFKIDEKEKEKKEKQNRINDFWVNLNDYRKIKKMQRKLNDTFLYREPILVENIMLDNYEDNSSCNNRNYSDSNNNDTLKGIDKIKYYTNKSFHNKVNKKKYKENKPYLTEIDY